MKPEGALTVLLEQIVEEVGVGRAWSFAELADELGIAERKLRGIARGAQRPCLDEALDIASTLSVPRHAGHKPRNVINGMLAVYGFDGAHQCEGAEAPHVLAVTAAATAFATEVLQAISPAGPGGCSWTTDEKRRGAATLDMCIAMMTAFRRDITPSS